MNEESAIKKLVKEIIVSDAKGNNGVSAGISYINIYEVYINIEDIADPFPSFLQKMYISTSKSRAFLYLKELKDRLSENPDIAKIFDTSYMLNPVQYATDIITEGSAEIDLFSKDSVFLKAKVESVKINECIDDDSLLDNIKEWFNS